MQKRILVLFFVLMLALAAFATDGNGSNCTYVEGKILSAVQNCYGETNVNPYWQTQSITSFQYKCSDGSTGTLNSEVIDNRYVCKDANYWESLAIEKCNVKVCTDPVVCTTEYAPVCGSDGITYSNSCYANLAGVTVAYEGKCVVACTKEGESYPVVPGYACCEGLIGIQPTATLVGNMCKMMVGSTLCSNCGNGVCEKWENKCNCSSDCNGIIVECNSDQDCRESVCPDGGFVHEVCLNNQCVQKSTCSSKTRATLGEKFELFQGKSIIVYDGKKEGNITSTSDLFTVQLDSVVQKIIDCIPGEKCPIMPPDAMANLTVTGICNAPEGAVCAVATTQVTVKMGGSVEIFSDYILGFLNLVDKKAIFVVHKKIPQVCPSLYAPVCGGKEICVKCASTSTSSSASNSAEDKCANGGGCFVEKKTYANKCIMELEGANFLYAGECGAAKTNYRNASWACYNGTEHIEGGESSCKPESLWRQYAEESCKKECNIDSNSTNASGYEKCGVNSFSVSNECSDNELTCGGIQGKICPEGYYCVYKGNYPDADGKCVKKPLGDFFKGAYWKCGNGQEYKESSEQCRSSSEWKDIAVKKCESTGLTTCPITSQTNVSSTVSTSTTTTPVNPITANIFAIVAAITGPTNLPAEKVAAVSTSSGSGGASSSVSNSTTTTTPVQGCISVRGYVSEFQLFNECTPKTCTHYIDANGCQVKKCENEDAQSYCPGDCRNQNFDEIKKIKENCNDQIIASTDEKGCSYYSCSSGPTVSTCQKKSEVPEEKFLSCKERGGELIVKELDNGCISFIDCIGSTSRGDTNVVKIPGPTDLLELALKLENLNIELGKLKIKLTVIQNYYIDTNNTSDANRIGNAIAVLSSIEAKIVELRAEIKDKINNFTEEDASALREGIREIKETKIKELVVALLG